VRRKILSISRELLVDFLREPVAPGIMQEGLPPDAEIVAATLDGRGYIALTIESREFEPSEGPDYPPLRVIYSREITA
jgi:hypothetical protein